MVASTGLAAGYLARLRAMSLMPFVVAVEPDDLTALDDALQVRAAWIDGSPG